MERFSRQLLRTGQTRATRRSNPRSSSLNPGAGEGGFAGQELGGQAMAAVTR